MAIKRHNLSWVGTYRKDTNSYSGTNTIRAGSSRGYNSYLGINSVAVLKDINSSKTSAKVWLNVYVTSPSSGSGVFALGMHKETTNKGSGTMPYYSYTGRRFLPVRGWRRYDITNFTVAVGGNSSFETALKNGYHGMVLYGQVGEANTVADGMSGNRAYIEIEGTWNTPPSKSSFIKPARGQEFDESVDLEWTQATDAEQSASQLYYDLSYWDGTKWHSRIRLRNKLSHTFDLSDMRETSRARFRLRVYDGESYSAYTYSNYFTVNHNKPPKIPTLRSPVGGTIVDRTNPVTFNWKHNDDDAQSRFKLRYRRVGDTLWTEIEKNTSAESETLSSGTLLSGRIEWQVKTYDQGDLESPWSDKGIFNSSEPSNAPEIIGLEGTTLSSETFSIQWSSSNQTDYEVELLLDNTVIQSWSGSSNIKTIVEEEILQNELEYTARVRIKTREGLWSGWSSATFNTSFTPPSDPTVIIREDNSNYSLVISVSNNEPLNDEPEVIRNIIERREHDSDTWVRLITDLENSEDFIDYTVQGDTVYEYKIIAIGDNGTSSEEVLVIASIEIDTTIISLANNLEEQIILRRVANRGMDIEKDARLLNFAGRSKRVVEFGELINLDLSINCTIYPSEYKQLLDLSLRQETILYRDARGRKIYAVIPSISISDIYLDRYKVDIPFIEVDYKEGIIHGH